ncbi:hypothetical protein V7024_06435 [Bacillus sp. JJ864]|uniref:hypothetical protein n=1 Tax=Bacillus sp. JJ864 TaxID=3122975 RepID=UPI0030006B1E
MVELLGSLLEGILISLPSKKNRTINKKFKLLRKENWYKKILEKYGALISMNDSVRNFVGQRDIEKILRNMEKTKEFQAELEEVLAKEKL